MRVLNYMILGLALLVGMGQSVSAQTAPLDEKQKAVVLFDVRLDRLQQSDLGRALGLKEQMAASSASSDIDFSKAVRVFGMMSAPESIEQIQQMQGGGGGDIPLDFSMRIQFADESALTDVLNKMKAEGTEFTKNGKTYYRPNDAQAPKNVCAGQVDSTTMVMGTETYVLLPDQKVAFSSGLQSAWGQVSKNEDTLRVVVDLVGAKTLIDQALEKGKEGADPLAQGFMDLVPNMNDVRLTMDFSGGNLLSLGSTCKDSESATSLKEALDSIFGMAKLAGEGQMNQMKQAPGMAPVAEVGIAILKSLNANVEGNSVSVNIPKPEGFEAAVQQAAGMMGGMMGGPGGQSAPGGFDGPPDGGDGGN